MASIPALYNLLPAQKDFLHVPQSDVSLDISLYQGGYGSGKTFSGVLRGLLISQKFPGIRGLACAKTYPLLRDTTLQTYFEVFDDLHFRDGKEYIWRASEQKLVFPKWGKSEILFRHLEKPFKLKSLNLGWVHVEEMSEVEEAVFMMLLSRLRQKGIPRHYLFGTTNPQANKGYIHRVFVAENKSKDGILYRRVMAPSTQNIYLPKEYLENMAGQFDEEYYRINVLGQDGDYTAGLVCKTWSHANIEDTGYKPDKPLYLSCDFNIDPNCWVVAHRYNREYHFIDELCLENTATVQAAEEFYRRYKDHKAGVIITGDASGQNRNAVAADALTTNYTIIRNTLSGLGMRNIELSLRSKNPNPESRTAAWNAMCANSLGVRRVFVNPKCKWLIWNCENLKYIPGSSVIFEPTAKQIEQDNKLKFTKHVWDAASYLVERYDPIRLDSNEIKGPKMTPQPFRPQR